MRGTTASAVGAAATVAATCPALSPRHP